MRSCNDARIWRRVWSASGDEPAAQKSSKSMPIGLAMALIVRLPTVQSSPSTVPPISFSRSEEHTSELQSLMRISYAVFCLKKKKYNTNTKQPATHTHNTHTTH